MSEQSISELLKAHSNEWMNIPGVVGVGEGLHQGKPCILVLVKKKSKQLSAQIPKQLESYPVVIQETGEVKAL